MTEDERGEIERLRARERTLAEENARLRAALGRGPVPSGGERQVGVTASPRADLLFTAAEKTQMAMVISDPNLPDNPIIFANRAFVELSGYAHDELIGRNCRFLQGEGTDPAEVARLRACIAARRDVVVEVLNYRRDGTSFRNELYVSPVFAADGRLLYFFGSQLDVTRFHDRERQALDGVAPYRLLMEAMEAGFCIIELRFDETGRAANYRFVEVNAAFARQSGLADAKGRWMRDLVPDHEQHWFDVYGGVARTGRTVRFRGLATALGRSFDVHAVRVGDASHHRVAVVFTDVAAGKDLAEVGHDEAEAEHTAERDLVWRVSRDLLVICGFDGFYRAVNPAWTTLLGWLPGRLVGTRLDALVHAEDRETVLAGFERVRSGAVVEADVRLLAADGAYRWFAFVAISQGDCVYATGRDITERRALEEQLRQSQKMEAVGQLTGGVAHDFNNLLTVIRSSTDLLQRPNLSEERRARYIGAIADTVDRAAKLTGQLLAFARRQALQPMVFDAAASVAAIGDMVRTLTGARIRVEIAVDRAAGAASDFHVDADPSQFDTALVNLAVNARDAMAGEGRLAIRVGRADAIPPVRAHPALAGDFVTVEIADTGTGIAPHDLDRIFEPFFTTKGVGQGTGLGLSQVFGFAKQSGGEVVAGSEPGAGATFRLYLPHAARSPAPTSMASAQVRTLAEGHGTRVLVVEDNGDIGAFATQALAELGFAASWVADAAQALARIEEAVDGFEVVFSDVMMPGMNGVELAREIALRRPNLPVVLTSGYSHVLASEGTHGLPLLRKPYSVADLSRVLREALHARTGVVAG